MTDNTLQANEQTPNDPPADEVEAEAVSPDEVQQAVRKLAEKRPEKLVEFMAMEMSSVGNPLHHKMTKEHIAQVLDLAAKHDERQYNLHTTSQSNDFLEGKSNRAYCFSAFVLILFLTVVVLFLFKDKPEVLVPILTGLGGMIGGFLGGWGLGKKQQ